MKSLIVCALLVVGLVATQPASASILGQNLTFNGSEELLTDESRGNIVDSGAGNVGVLGVGDAIYGYVQFDQVSKDGAGNTPITGGIIAALFAIEVTGDLGGGVFTHGASTVTGAKLTDLATALVAEGIGGDAVDASSMFLIVSSATSASPVNTATDLTFFTPAAWDIEATGGVVAANGDFFQVKVTGSLEAGAVWQESASLSVLQHVLGPGTICLDDVGSDVLTDGDTAFDTFGQIAIRSGNVQKNDNPDASNWYLQDNGNFAVNATPEPTTFAVWAILGLCGFGTQLRRRYKKTQS